MSRRVLVAVTGWMVERGARLRRRTFTRVGDVMPIRRFWEWTTARLGPPTSSLRARLRLQGVAGLTLLVGLVVVTFMAVGFTDLLDDVLGGDGLAIVDQPSARWLAQHRDVWLTQVLVAVTHGGGPAGQSVWLVLVCALAAVRGRSWLPALLGAVGGGGIAAMIARQACSRSTPPDIAVRFLPTSGFSFPSGHATGAAAIGLLCVSGTPHGTKGSSHQLHSRFQRALSESVRYSPPRTVQR